MEKTLTGDGSDVLFAGYSFLYDLPLEELPKELRKISKVMEFSSESIAEDLGVEVKLPYLQERFREFAMDIEPSMKVGKKDGEKIGKWILRKAYEGRLLDEIIWRKKTPIEERSGTRILPKKFDVFIKDEDFELEREKTEKEEDVEIRSKEQLFYYRIYRSLFGPPSPEDPEGRMCPYSGVNIPDDMRFCRTCGSGIESENP